MRLCFGFLMKTVVVRHYDYRAILAQSQGHFSSSCCPASKDLEWNRELKGDIARTVDRDWPKKKDIPYHTMSCSAIKLAERRRKNAMYDVLASSQEAVTHGEPCFHGVGCASACWWEVTTEFPILLCLCTAFALPTNCLYLNLWVLNLVSFLFSLPLHLGSLS